MISKFVGLVKGLGAFSMGMFIGTCYGSAVGALTAYVMLSLS